MDIPVRHRGDPVALMIALEMLGYRDLTPGSQRYPAGLSYLMSDDPLGQPASGGSLTCPATPGIVVTLLSYTTLRDAIPPASSGSSSALLVQGSQPSAQP